MGIYETQLSASDKSQLRLEWNGKGWKADSGRLHEGVAKWRGLTEEVVTMAKSSKNGNTCKARYSIDDVVWIFASKDDMTAFMKNPELSFEFDPSNSDNGGDGVFAALDGCAMDLTTGNSTASMSIVDKAECKVAASIEVVFDVALDDQCDEDRFNQWAEDEGGYFCCYVTPKQFDPETSSDEGQRLCLVTDED
jgi:hypothetical protein